MKIKRKINWVILTVGLICSCSNQNGLTPDFNENSFKESVPLQNGEKYRNDSLFFGIPYYLKFHCDSFLIYLDLKTTKKVKIIDLKNKRIQEVISSGRGPGEMLAPWGLEVIGKDVYVFCLQLVKVIKLSPDKNRNFHVTEEFKLEEMHTTSFHPLTKDLFVCTSNIGDVNRLTFLNSKGEIIKKLGDYPAINGQLKPDNEIFSSFISGTPEGDKIILACNSIDVLEIYNTKDGLIRRLHGPVGIQQTVSYENIGAGFHLIRDPNFSTFGPIQANKDEFWVCYTGYKFEKDVPATINDTFPKRIYCFDWKGNPIRKMELDYTFHGFDIDWNGKVLYTLEIRNGNPEIFRYSLINILK
jgi:hypothetical protein